MFFATLLLLSPLPLFGDVVLPVANSAPVIAVKADKDSGSELPTEFTSAGVIAPAVVSEFSAASMPQPAAAEPASIQPGAAIQPGTAQPAGFGFQPMKPATHRSYDNGTQKKEWYALMIAAHAGAAFDAWSTRRALSGNWGTEADPLMRPFAHSGTIYVATQVGPVLMDLLGRRAMVSERPWVRKFWWLPQTLSASMSFQAGAHNVGVVH
jgi:hypothetical protein